MIWNDKYSVGIKEFDEQHKSIILMLNQLWELIGENDDHKELKELIQQISDYARVHFSTEEHYLEKHKYYGLEDHKKEHRMYEDTIQKFQAKYDSSKEDVRVELIEFLADWWMAHIQGCDMEYTRFLNNHGVF